MGLRWDSYEAYCLDEAVIFFGIQLEARLESAGHKPSKEERKVKAVREKILNEVFGDSGVEETKTSFADPALMFS